MKKPIITLGIVLGLLTSGLAQAQVPDRPRSALEVGPDADIWFLQYNFRPDPNSEFMVGVVYLNTAIAHLIPYPGVEQIYAVEAGYRYFLIAGLHAEVTVLPQLVDCWEQGAGTRTVGWGLATEVRAGYQFDFVTFGQPWYLNLQWFAGYHWVNPKPAAFQQVDGGSFYTSPVPMFLFGFRF